MIQVRMIAAVALAGAVTMPAWGLRIAMPAPTPIPQRVANADVTVVGKVTAIAPAEKAEMFKGDTRELRVATVKVESMLIGPAGREIKVGFFEQPKPGPGGGIRPPIRFAPPKLDENKEYALFLTQHPTKKDVYVIQGQYDVIAKENNPNFKTEVAEARKGAKSLLGATKALESKSAAERLQAAGMLINRYKTTFFGDAKTEAVPATESKAILTALAEAEWGPMTGRFDANHPRNLFLRLGVTEKDGFKMGRIDQLDADAKKWLADNAATFKMTRFVRGKIEAPVTAEPE
jgi:hypothetical protein